MAGSWGGETQHSALFVGLRLWLAKPLLLLPEISGSLSSSDLSAAISGRVGCAPQARTPLPVIPSCPLFQSRACVPCAPYIPKMSRLPEIHFSGSLLIRQGVGWVDKPNTPQFNLLGYACSQPNLLLLQHNS